MDKIHDKILVQIFKVDPKTAPDTTDLDESIEDEPEC